VSGGTEKQLRNINTRCDGLLESGVPPDARRGQDVRRLCYGRVVIIGAKPLSLSGPGPWPRPRLE
jgi:hypothetical protein